MKLSEVKTYMAKEIPVQYEDIYYVISACTMRISKGNWYYQLELKNGNYVIIVNMEKV